MNSKEAKKMFDSLPDDEKREMIKWLKWFFDYASNLDSWHTAFASPFDKDETYNTDVGYFFEGLAPMVFDLLEQVYDPDKEKFYQENHIYI